MKMSNPRMMTRRNNNQNDLWSLGKLPSTSHVIVHHYWMRRTAYTTAIHTWHSTNHPHRAVRSLLITTNMMKPRMMVRRRQSSAIGSAAAARMEEGATSSTRTVLVFVRLFFDYGLRRSSMSLYFAHGWRSIIHTLFYSDVCHTYHKCSPFVCMHRQMILRAVCVCVSST